MSGDFLFVGVRLYDFDLVISQLSRAGIAVDGLFCDLDAGFNSKELIKALISYGLFPMYHAPPNPKNGGESAKE